jgi:CBS domain-containing protein
MSEHEQSERSQSEATMTAVTGEVMGTVTGAGTRTTAASSSWQVDAGLAVARFMRQEVAYLRENMWVDAAVDFLNERGLRDAPVLDDDGRPVGVLYVDDVETEESFAEFERGGGEEIELASRYESESALMRGYGLGPGFHIDGRRRLRVREVMVPYIPEIAADASIASAALVMHDNQLDHVMVVGDDGRAVGTFSREELVQWLVDQTGGLRRAPVPGVRARCLRDVMHPAISVRRRASLLTARDLLTTHDLHELPVLEGGHVVGLVLEADLYGLMNAHRDGESDDDQTSHGHQETSDRWMQELLVEDVMKPAPAAYHPEDSLANVLASSPIGDCLLVEQEGRLIGVVSTRDLRARVDSDLLDHGAARPEMNLR